MPGLEPVWDNLWIIAANWDHQGLIPESSKTQDPNGQGMQSLGTELEQRGSREGKQCSTETQKGAMGKGTTVGQFLGFWQLTGTTWGLSPRTANLRPQKTKVHRPWDQK